MVKCGKGTGHRTPRLESKSISLAQLLNIKQNSFGGDDCLLILVSTEKATLNICPKATFRRAKN